MAWLGALRQLDLDHLHLVGSRLFGEEVGVEASLVRSAAEVARSDLPDQITASVEMVVRDPPLACVVSESTNDFPFFDLDRSCTFFGVFDDLREIFRFPVFSISDVCNTFES